MSKSWDLWKYQKMFSVLVTSIGFSYARICNYTLFKEHFVSIVFVRSVIGHARHHSLRDVILLVHVSMELDRLRNEEHFSQCNIKGTTNLYLIFFYLFRTYTYLFYVPLDPIIGSWIPKRWSYSWLWAAWHGFLELKPGPLWRQQVLLSADPLFQPWSLFISCPIDFCFLFGKQNVEICGTLL